MREDFRRQASLRLKTAVGHLQAVHRMVEQDVYCVDIMKQLAAVQASLESVQQVVLRNHLSTCVSDAIRQGMGEAIIDELMQTVKFQHGPETMLAPCGVHVGQDPDEKMNSQNGGDLTMEETTFKVKGMTCAHCQATVTGALEKLDGVSKAEVSLEQNTAQVQFDSKVVSEAELRAAVEKAGYEVPV